MSRSEFLEKSEDILWKEYIENYVKDIDEEVEALKMIVEEMRKLLCIRVFGAPEI